MSVLLPCWNPTPPLTHTGLRVALLNLMPGKKATERQILQLLGDSNQPMHLSLFSVQHKEAEEQNHPDGQDPDCLRNYQPIAAAWKKTFDALIITGAPVGQKRFEDITFWPELTRTYEWARTHVGSTLNICWAAAAALKHFRNVERTLEPDKLFGVYPQQIWTHGDPLVHGLQDGFPTPVSRYSIVRPHRVQYLAGFEVIAANPVTGIGLARDTVNRQVLAFNHLEYARGTLAREYERDCARGLNPAVPFNYFPENNPDNAPLHTWEQARQSFARSWIAEVRAMRRFTAAPHPSAHGMRTAQVPALLPAYAG